jgi:hypothetical protein
MTVALPPLVIPERFNMARYCLAAQAERLPDKPALVVVDDPAPGTPPLETWTFAQMEDAIAFSSGSTIRARIRSSILVRLRRA